LNLTRIRNVAESVQFHYCESLFSWEFPSAAATERCGHRFGRGFPGIPVAILRPDCSVTLVESHQRKAVFLREAARDLPNVRILSHRAEDVDGAFDWLISRAVSPAEVLRLTFSREIALLIGEEDSAKLNGASIPVPWGNHRILFHVKPTSGGNS